MFFYKNPKTNDVFCYESELDREKYGAKELEKMSKQEIDVHLSKSVFIPSVEVVTRAQGKASLIRAGLWSGVVDFVNSISDPVEKSLAEVALNDTTHWQRSSPFLNSAADALGLTDEQLDQLFIDASKIEL